MSDQDKAQSERAKAQAEAFAARPKEVAGQRLRHPSVAGLYILNCVDNRLVRGLDAAQSKKVFPNIENKKSANRYRPDPVELMKYMRDVYQIYTLCTAPPEQVEAWFEDVEAFRKAASHFAATAEHTSEQMTDIFISVFEWIGRINESEVEVKEPPKSKGSTPKKKATNPRSSQATRSR